MKISVRFSAIKSTTAKARKIALTYRTLCARTLTHV